MEDQLATVILATRTRHRSLEALALALALAAKAMDNMESMALVWAVADLSIKEDVGEDVHVEMYGLLLVTKILEGEAEAWRLLDVDAEELSSRQP